jgi:hypothetical protein
MLRERGPGGGALPEGDSDEDDDQPAELLDGERFPGNGRAEEHAGHRVQQPDEPDCRGGQVPEPGEPRSEGESRRDDRDVAETEDRRCIEHRRCSFDRRRAYRKVASMKDIIASTEAIMS